MPPSSLSTGREVSESLFEALLTEMGALYAAPGAALPSKVVLESIGYQVGMQLCERCVTAGCVTPSCSWLTRPPAMHETSLGLGKAWTL